jgi:uncharacterized membrane protein YoaK (UPF0700 family)
MIDLSQLVIPIIFFFAGGVSGYLTHDHIKRTVNMTEESSKNFLLVVVTAVWAISMLADLASPNYDVPVAVHAIMGAIVGFFFYRPKGEGK